MEYNIDNDIRQIRRELIALADFSYAAFQARLIPDVPADKIIGVRTPALRKYTQRIKHTHFADSFLSTLPHEYYDENNLHGFLLEDIKNPDVLIEELDRFLPHIDNWATCDSVRPQIIKKYPEKFLPKIYEWMASDHTYTVRYAIGLLNSFYLDTEYADEAMEAVSKKCCDRYYVNMMIAWFFSTALTKDYNAAIKYLEDRRLTPWVHNKTIQKANDSLQILTAKKEYLSSLKIALTD